MYVLFFLISFLASSVGAVCGIGGGIITKPVLDATGIMGVGEVSFLSGCTVLAMSAISVYKSVRKRRLTDLKTTTPLAIGAAVGGIVGKQIFEIIYQAVPDKDIVGMVQSALFFLTTAGTLFYHVKENKIRTYHNKNIPICVLIGLFLGLVSSFLGVGGGPINIVILGFFFSLGIKEAAAGSLYVILFSQSASFLNSVITNTIPDVNPFYLLFMIAGGVAGGLLGNRINAIIEPNKVRKLFLFLMIIVILISVYNFVRFAQ